MEEKAKKLEAQIGNLEEGKTAMKNLLVMIPDILTSVTKNLEEISKVLEGSNIPKPIVDLEIDEDTIKIGTMESAPGGTAKRTRASMKKDNLPPPTNDTPPVVTEKQDEKQAKEQVKEQVEVEVEHEEEKIEEVNTENIDPESNILFTMNVVTQDINVIIDKSSENVEEKKTEATNIEIFEPPVNTLDSQNIMETTEVKKTDTISDATPPNIEKLEEAQAEAEEKAKTKHINVDIQKKVEKPVEKEPEQSIAEPTVNKTESKDDSKIINTVDTQSDKKEEKMNKDEDNDGNTEEVVKIALTCKVDNIVGSIVLDQEMVVYEEKIEKIEKEKARLRLKARELKNKLGPRLDILLTHRNGLSKATIPGGRSLEEQMHHLTDMI
ncbi:uncharacterized protein LOC131857899 [Cryptomeria japonica]|uniref:uncharacterized protein LOC131857899 n=1 Tax=Cryptomeria japonica TaxID=3369 RepID=UPI0027DA9A4E|nr:uncharacterized protein LOC131857899 [Cryptomeria japonica]